MTNESVNLEELTILIPRKTDVLSSEDRPVKLWTVVEQALNRIGADEFTRDAAREAIKSSDGCVVLANYLNSEAKRIHKMDYSFKVPLIVYAAEMARIDGAADSIYDTTEGAIYFETDEGQYSFHVFKDWTVDWTSVADEVVTRYEWSGIENQTWALDQLLAYLDVPIDRYAGQPDDSES